MKINRRIFLAGILLLLAGMVPVKTYNTPEEIVGVGAWSGPQSSTAGSYYNSVSDTLEGSALSSKLKSIISGPNTSYDWSRYEAADEAEGKSDSVLLIYSRKVEKKNAHVSGSTGWNREHTYPDSKISGAAESDNHQIFADDNQTNNTRGNNPFGVVAETAGNRVKDGYGNLTDNYTSGGYFMPNPQARGEVARATMYVNVLYGYSITGNFQSVALMLRWHLENPVSNREIYRNNTVHTLQKNRNPFIDHPEYACRIWGETNSDTRNVCNSSGSVDVTSVSVSPSSGSISLLEMNKTLQLSATVLPSNASNKNVTWTSSNPSVATVSNTGNVTGLTVGTTTITAKSVADQTKLGTATITVTNNPISVTGVSLSETNVSLVVNNTKTINANILPANATNKNVTWESLNTSVATVSSNGLVTAKSVGSTTVRVTTSDGGKQASATINVTAAPPQSSEQTYTFTNKNWTATPTNWTSKGDGGNYEGSGSARGVQFLGGNKGGANSPYFTNVTKVVVGTAASNNGAGTYSAYLVSSGSAALESGEKIGSDITVNKPGATIIDREFVLASPMSGHVQVVVSATGNSLYVKYVKVYTAEVSVDPSEEATSWAQAFLDGTAEGCNLGDALLLANAWQPLKTSYNELSVDAKTLFENSTPNAAGDAIEHALARYIVIVEAYRLEGFISGISFTAQKAPQALQIDRLIVPGIFTLGMILVGGLVLLSVKRK